MTWNRPAEDAFPSDVRSVCSEAPSRAPSVLQSEPPEDVRRQQESVADMEKKIMEFRDEYANLMAQVSKIKAEMADVEEKCSRSSKLISNLSADRPSSERPSRGFQEQSVAAEACGDDGIASTGTGPGEFPAYGAEGGNHASRSARATSSAAPAGAAQRAQYYKDRRPSVNVASSGVTRRPGRSSTRSKSSRTSGNWNGTAAAAPAVGPPA